MIYLWVYRIKKLYFRSNLVKGINKCYLELGVLFLFSAFVVNSCVLSVDEQEMIVPVNAMWHIYCYGKICIILLLLLKRLVELIINTFRVLYILLILLLFSVLHSAVHFICLSLSIKSIISVIAVWTSAMSDRACENKLSNNLIYGNICRNITWAEYWGDQISEQADVIAVLNNAILFYFK